MLNRYKRIHHLTNKQLSKLLGLSQMTVFRILHNKNIGPKSIKAMAKLLNVSELEIYEYYKL